MKIDEIMNAIYFDAPWIDNNELLRQYLRMTPNNSGIWQTIQATKEPQKADCHIVINTPSVKSYYADRYLFCREPPCLPDCKGWEHIDAKCKYPIEEYYMPQTWSIEKSYDDLVKLDPPEKSRSLSWVTSDKGKNLNIINMKLREHIMKCNRLKHKKKPYPLTTPTDGHILRMKFHNELVSKYNGKLDIHGRGNFKNKFYRGQVEDKWDALRDYKYSLAIENYQGPNYWSEKISDVLLAWSMPIYWGCTNLDEFLPEGSFIQIDIESPSCINEIEKIVSSGMYEKNLDAIAQARDLILNTYQIWPTAKNAIEGQM